MQKVKNWVMTLHFIDHNSRVDRDDQENSCRIENKKPRSRADSKKDSQNPMNGSQVLSELFAGQLEGLDESGLFGGSRGNQETEKARMSYQPRLSTADWEKPDKSKKNEKTKSMCESMDSETAAKMQKVHANEVKEILGLRVEVDLLKFSEQALKEELNVPLKSFNVFLYELPSTAKANRAKRVKARK
mgnify:FL=1